MWFYFNKNIIITITIITILINYFYNICTKIPLIAISGLQKKIMHIVLLMSLNSKYVNLSRNSASDNVHWGPYGTLSCLSGILAGDWAVHLPSSPICAVIGSTVVLPCSYDYPQSSNETWEEGQLSAQVVQ